MQVFHEKDLRPEAVLEVAKRMMIAARTAPKGKGVDNIEIALLKKEGIKEVTEKLKEMVKRDNLPAFFLRDAVNLESAEVMVLLGTKIDPLGLDPCGMCGFADCDEKRKHPIHPCAFNTGDLGIAVGSAASVAMDNRVDNRVMYTAGQAVLELGCLGDDVKIAYCIPLSVSGKSPFFDRNMAELIKKA